MKEMEITSDWIDRYNDGDLGPAEREYFEQQLSQNKILRAEVRLDARLNRFLSDGDLRDLMEKAGSVTLKHRPGGHLLGYLLVAATLAGLVTVGIMSYYSRDSKGPYRAVVSGQVAEPGAGIKTGPAGPEAMVSGNQGKTTGTDAREKGSAGRLLAANFQPMAEFEMLVGSVVRSGLVRVTAPTVRSMVTAGSPLKFAWRRGQADLPVTVVLMNNLGKTMLESAGLIADSATIRTNGLPPGLYYWKVILQDELVVMGKVVLK